MEMRDPGKGVLEEREGWRLHSPVAGGGPQVCAGTISAPGVRATSTRRPRQGVNCAAPCWARSRLRLAGPRASLAGKTIIPSRERKPCPGSTASKIQLGFQLFSSRVFLCSSGGFLPQWRLVRPLPDCHQGSRWPIGISQSAQLALSVIHCVTAARLSSGPLSRPEPGALRRLGKQQYARGTSPLPRLFLA